MLTQLNRPALNDPISQMRRLQAEMNRLFEGAQPQRAQRAFPPVNFWLGDNSVVVTAELPGISQDDIDLTVQEDVLHMRGERSFANNDDQVSWHRRERTAGSFSRSIELPFRVDPDKVQARFKDGVLEVEMQRPDADRPRKIAIKS